MNAISAQGLANPVSWTNFWQLSALLLLVGFVSRFLAPREPHFTYLLWMLVMIKAVWPVTLSSPLSPFSQARSWWNASQPRESSRPFEGASLTIPELHRTTLVEQAGSPHQATSSTIAGNEAAAATNPSTGVPGHAAGYGWIQVLAAWGPGVWLAGVIGTLGLSAVRRLVVQRILRQGQPAADQLQIRLRMLVEHKIKRRLPVRLVTVDRPLGPATVGIFRPTILLPAQFVAQATDEELDAVLSHELAHVVRRDGWAALLQTAAVALWWFHPLMHWASRQASRVRELSCDDMVLARFDIAPPQYARTLLKVLELQVTSRWQPVLSMAISSATTNRLYRIARRSSCRSSTPSWSWLVWAALLACLVPGAAPTISAQTPATSPAPEVRETRETRPTEPPADAPSAPVFLTYNPPVAATSKTPANTATVVFEGQVFDENDQPLAGATIRLLRQPPDSEQPSMLVAVTDEQGRVSFPPLALALPEPEDEPMFSESIQFVGSSDRHGLFHSAAQLTFSEGRAVLSILPTWQPNDFVTGVFQAKPSGQIDQDPQSDTDFRLRAAKGPTSISGQVRSPDGPVAGLQVRVSEIRTSPDEIPWQLGGSAPLLGLTTITDAQGKWSLRNLPAGCRVQLAFSRPPAQGYTQFVTHIDTDEETARLYSGKEELNSVEQRHVSPMQLELPVLYQVVIQVREPNGQSVEGGAVVELSQPAGDATLQISWAEATTGPTDIRMALPAGRMPLRVVPVATVKLSPLETTINVQPAQQEQTFPLQFVAAALLDLQFVDEPSGAPIASLPVTVEDLTNADTVRLQNRLTIFQVQAGQLRQTVAPKTVRIGVETNFEHSGYEVINPLPDPIRLEPGQTFSHVFRLRPMQVFRWPRVIDDTDLCSARHQQAAALLRANGAHLFASLEARATHVQFSETWTGTQDDLQRLADLDFVTSIWIGRHLHPAVIPAETRPVPIVTDGWLEAIGEITNLQGLFVQRADISGRGIERLLQCKELRDLSIASDTYTGERLSELAKLTQLRSLSLAAPLTSESVSELGQFAQLEVLSLDTRQPLDASLAKFKAPLLTTLMIQSAANAQVQSLDRFPELSYVILSGPGITNGALPGFRKIKSQLKLAGTSVTDEGLAGLANSSLQSLHLEGPFTDACVRHLKQMNNLIQVTFGGSTISEAAEAELKIWKPNLAIYQRR